MLCFDDKNVDERKVTMKIKKELVLGRLVKLGWSMALVIIMAVMVLSRMGGD